MLVLLFCLCGCVFWCVFENNLYVLCCSISATNVEAENNLKENTYSLMLTWDLCFINKSIEAAHCDSQALTSKHRNN